MKGSPGTLACIAALLVLFFGGAVVGLQLAESVAPGSWIAQVVSFFALPLAFAVGLQAWYGLALLGLLRLLVRRVRSAEPPAPAAGRGPVPLPGTFVFLPLSSAAGAMAGVIVGLVSSTYSFWQVALLYGMVGTLHGLLAWRLARGGYLMPPETV